MMCSLLGDLAQVAHLVEPRWTRERGQVRCDEREIERALASEHRRVLVAGVVTHRQRPATAGGTTFINLEDETGLINIVVSKGCWQRHLTIARSAPALLVRGRVENAENVVNIIAERLEPLPLGGALRSRDFR